MGYSVQDLRRVRVPKIHYPALAAPTSANPSVNHLSALIVGNPLEPAAEQHEQKQAADQQKRQHRTPKWY